MYGVYKVEGVVVANEWAELDQTDSDAALKAGKTTLDNVVLYSSTTANTTTGEGVAQSGQIAFNVSTGVETLGKTVTLYIEKTTILSDSKVLGVSLKDSVNVIEATAPMLMLPSRPSTRPATCSSPPTIWLTLT